MICITDGIINVNKPLGWTSHDCIAVLRKVLGIKRVGHTGTLDPMAGGVLPICIGPSTRIMEYLDLDFKTYRCKMKLGLETDTQDIWGEITGERDTGAITEDGIRMSFQPFKGSIEQIPPKYSAIKVNGKKLYQYARAGEEVEIKPRRIFIKELSIKEIDMEEKTILYEVVCSKGTYIRSLCRDIGEILGCGAVMTGLTRTASGIFTIEDAIDLETLRHMTKEKICEIIIKTDFPLTHFGKVLMNEDRASYFVNGGHISMEDVVLEEAPEYEQKKADIQVREEYKRAYKMYLRGEGGDIFLGVAFYSREFKKLVADKVFYRG